MVDAGGRKITPYATLLNRTEILAQQPSDIEELHLAPSPPHSLEVLKLRKTAARVQQRRETLQYVMTDGFGKQAET